MNKTGPIVRMFMLAAAVAVICYMAVWLVLAYQIRRATRLFEDAQQIRVGASEESIRPMLERFGGHRLDIQLGYHEDYNYVFEISPWRSSTASSGQSAESVYSIERALNPRFRRAVGFRKWRVGIDLAMKQDRVVAVQSVAIVEGRRRWLGAMWHLSEIPPEFERIVPPDALPDVERRELVTPGILNLETGTGTSWTVWMTPSSPADQRRIAHRLNFGCIRSFSGCDTVCDLLPEAPQYFREHPELAPKGGGWDDKLRSCLKRDPQVNANW